MTDITLHQRGTVFVLSAPSGTGKDTVIARVLQEESRLRRCITVTTRAAAANERDGVDYFFRTVPEFERLAEAGELLEWAEVHGNFYGTPKGWVLAQIEAGLDVVLVIDVQGARQVRQRMEGVVTVFLAPPSLPELERRIRARGRESERSIALRLQNAATEMRCLRDYEYFVVNDDLEKAVSQLRAILTAERCRIRPETPVEAVVEAILSPDYGGNAS